MLSRQRDGSARFEGTGSGSTRATLSPRSEGVGPSVRRGIVAGLLAGLAAGLFALLVAAPAVDAAIALEEAAGAAAGGEGLARSTQRIGLVVGTAVFGAAMGVAFGVAAAFARGRIVGDAWRRSLVIGAVAVFGLVIVPALAYPPNPPGVGDPGTVGLRAGLYLALAGLGVLVIVAAWQWQRWLVARKVRPATAQVVVLTAAMALLGAVLALRPDLGGAVDFPAELLWQFRLSSIATQVILWSVMAVAHGWLSSRAESRHLIEGQAVRAG